MNTFRLSLFLFLCSMLVACSEPTSEVEDDQLIKLIRSEKSLPSDYHEKAFQRESSPYFEYLFYKVDHQKSFEEAWSLYRLEQPMAEVNFEENDVYFIGLQESGSCPYESDHIKMSIESEALKIHFSQPKGNCTLDATPRTIVIVLNKDSSADIKKVVIGESGAETDVPVNE